MKIRFKMIGIAIAFLLLATACSQTTATPTAASTSTSVDPQTSSSAATQRTISVTGSGQVDVQPDQALVTVGVQTQAKEAAAAISQNNQGMQQVIDALEQAGVAAEDIQTRVLELQPQFTSPSPNEPAPQGPPQIVGYMAVNTVDVRVRDLQRMGDLIDAAVQAGANQIQNIRFVVSQPQQVTDQAREAAWNDALHKAEQLASLAGTQLGQVQTIQETSAPSPVFQEVLGKGGGVAAVPIQPGTQTVQVTLQVTWLLPD
jgi:uncharacterized protein YggE